MPLPITTWIFFLAFLAPGRAHAFGLADHKRMTLQAVSEFSACFPGSVTAAEQNILWTLNLEEDLNVLRKDFMYSHFFNPDKKLKMRRFDSLSRVGSLERALAKTESREAWNARDYGPLSFAHLGHIFHHLQDMASPPHVVPVMHNLGDGFESLEVDPLPSSGLSCEEIAADPPSSLKDLLVGTARETLANVAKAKVTLEAGGHASVESGEAFWKASSDDSFGEYGPLGNHFGAPSFTEAGIDYKVPVSFYRDFKNQQFKLGLKASLKALYWARIAHRPAINP